MSDRASDGGDQGTTAAARPAVRLSFAGGTLELRGLDESARGAARLPVGPAHRLLPRAGHRLRRGACAR